MELARRWLPRRVQAPGSSVVRTGASEVAVRVMSFTWPVSAFCRWPARVLLAVLENSPGWACRSNETVSVRSCWV